MPRRRIHQELTQQERRAKRELTAALALLVLSARSTAQLIASASSASHGLQRAIRSLHAAPRRLANGYTGDEGAPEPTETVEPLLVASAALGVVSGVIGTTQALLSQGQAFPEALEGALSAAQPRLDRIAVTETMTAFNGQVRANLETKVGEFRWDATLDQKTCARCERLNGKTWERLSDVPAIPAHVNCRCILQFIPSEP